MLCVNSLVFAEEFKVSWNLAGLDRSDESKVEELPNIEIDISNISNKEQKAKKVAESVLKRELGDTKYGQTDRVTFVLKAIEKKWFMVSKL